jgi:YidC/Oxa1 family membrane protein insertase
MLHTALLANPPLGCPLPTKAIGSSIVASIARPIAEVLAGVYSVVPNFAVAILVLSLLWMLIISPLTLKSTRSMLAMQRLQPQLKKLQAEHKNDRQAFAQAQMDLFKEHNVSPLGGCLPMLLPLPVFFALFRVIDGLSARTTYHLHGVAVSCPTPNYLSPSTAMFKAIVGANGKIDSFGLNLANNALSPHGSFAAALPYFVLLLVMIGTQYLQTSRMMSRNPAAANNPQSQIMKYLPIIFGVIFIKFPAGVILYYAMSNVCRVAQQELMYLFDPKVKVLANRELAEVTSEIDQIERGTRKRARTPGGDASPTRNRFRDLLADVREQAQSSRPPAGTKTGSKGSSTTKPTPTSPRKSVGTRSGAPPKGSSPTRAGQAAKSRPEPSNAPRANGAGANGNGGTGSDLDTSPPKPTPVAALPGDPRSRSTEQPARSTSRTGATGARPGGQAKRRRGR